MVNSIEDRIINYLRQNRVSTTEVADCLGKTGELPDLRPCTAGYYKAGRVRWVYAFNESNWSLHEQIQNIEEGNIILVDTYNCGNRAVFGRLTGKYILVHRQSEAIVVMGKMRDAEALLMEKWPIWCKGFTPVGCFNDKPKDVVNEAWKNEHYQLYEGSIAVCDDCGVVIIPRDHINECFLNSLSSIEEQEDIWFDRLDHYGESTFDIVCRKKYLNDETYMSIKNSESVRKDYDRTIG